MEQHNHNTIKYLAVFEPAEEGGYNVSFPELPGCVTFGTTFEEAKTKAQEILELWLEELASAGQPIVSRNVRPILDEVTATIPAGAHVSYATAQS